MLVFLTTTEGIPWSHSDLFSMADSSDTKQKVWVCGFHWVIFSLLQLLVPLIRFSRVQPRVLTKLLVRLLSILSRGHLRSLFQILDSFSCEHQNNLGLFYLIKDQSEQHGDLGTRIQSPHSSQYLYTTETKSLFPKRTNKQLSTIHYHIGSHLQGIQIGLSLELSLPFPFPQRPSVGGSIGFIAPLRLDQEQCVRICLTWEKPSYECQWFYLMVLFLWFKCNSIYIIPYMDRH